MKKVKKKKRLIRNLKVLLVFVLTTLFVFYMKSLNLKNNPPKEDTKVHETKANDKVSKYEYQNKIVNKTKTELNEEIEKLLVDFFNVYYRSMKELKLYETNDFFTTKSKDKLLYKASIEMLIESRKRQMNDLSLSRASYDLTITKIKEKENGYYIELNEDSYIDFKFLDYTSKVYNILNTFEIVKENDQYKIKDYYKEQGQFVMVMRLLDEKKDYESQISKITSDYISEFDKEAETKNKQYQKYLSNKNKTFKSCDHAYDREKAVSYALKYVRTREEGIVISESNCQNYASWAMNHGGIPMDTKGNYVWYQKSTPEKQNRSSTWAAVGYFYTYAKNNTGYGLCSEVDVNPYYAQKGDIVQVGYGGKYRHTAFVIDTFKKDGNVVDVILSSNTGDLEYYPLSAYPYPEKRLINILGWND